MTNLVAAGGMPASIESEEALEDLLLYGKNLVLKGKEESVVIESKEDIRLKGEKIHNN